MRRVQRIRAAARRVLTPIAMYRRRSRRLRRVLRRPANSVMKCITPTTFVPAIEKSGIDLGAACSILYKRTPRECRPSALCTPHLEIASCRARQAFAIKRRVWQSRAFLRWPSGAPRKEWDGPNAASDLRARLPMMPTCKPRALRIPLALGWMTHIYPNETEPDRFDRRTDDDLNTAKLSATRISRSTEL